MEKDLANPSVSLKIRQIEFRTHAHNTESIEKVKNSFLNLIPEEILLESFQINNCSGAFSQKILDVLIVLKIQKSIKYVVEKIAEKLSKEDKNLLKFSFENRLDEKLKFYFRLDKQFLALGNVKLAETNDVIQITIAIQNKSHSHITTDNIKKYFMDLNLL
ncbi:MAG: RNA-binding domain-containing protein [Promethearchaeota archaeon]